MIDNAPSRGIPPQLRQHLSDQRQASRQKILDAACVLFIQLGYAKTSVAAIAKAAGVAPATVYNAFATKRAIFEALVENRITEAQWPFLGPIPRFVSADGAAKFIATRLRDAFIDSDIPALAEVALAEADAFPELRVLYRTQENEDLTQALAERVLAELVEQGLFRVDNVAFAARQFLGMLNQALIHERRTRGTPIDDLDAYLDACVELFCKVYAV